ncbi:isoprenylcysteine carboxylmethyltransferase family protein [Aliiroseovarius sp. KMU-50]|uniref:Isoprenylcysteine carboxylmethyltransferase family protein n=1 Tax=Aliiroseovarius salicola TaxID=3009082 RepID=A0ABT4W1T3_9RHOB|nr:isoprenylcysteine carboxylmethyltransferase family protein [Aliiroseovarius sp. KMU-50]MDA5094460.1 isoprenylcysteine carboxylmethyltransferase family protein [Aliiroseovarius sp. KMU-50]
MQKLDLPPIWLLGLLAVAYVLHSVVPGLGFGVIWMRGLGVLLAGVGLAIMLAAIWEFIRARTSIIPRQKPTTFLRRGIYRYTRNPIYLGDVLVLAGAILWLDVLPGLILIPLFILLINNRFILGEEAMLRELYGEDYEDWAKKVRRWL